MAKKQAKQGCHLIICEDEKTGRVILRPVGGCPRGYVQRMRERVAAEDLYFVESRVVDDDEKKEKGNG